LSVEASLAVGVGMFKLEGSGKYLSNTKRSKHEVCFTATYSIENRTRRIPMEVISTIEHARQALDSGATHVVTSVEEGGSASMKFKFLASSAEEAKEISGRLKVVAQIAAVTIEGMAQVVLGNFEAVRLLLSVFDFSSSFLLFLLFLLFFFFFFFFGFRFSFYVFSLSSSSSSSKLAHIQYFAVRSGYFISNRVRDDCGLQNGQANPNDSASSNDRDQ